MTSINAERTDQEFRYIFENSKSLVQSVDENGNFVYVNKAWKQALGYSDEELKSMNFTQILKKDHIQSCTDVFNKIKEGKKVDDVETVFISKEGKEVYVRGSITAYFKSGKFSSTRGIFRDISQEKEKEKEVYMNEELYRTLFEKANDAILILESDTTILACNEKTLGLFSCNKEDIIGKTPYEISPLKQPDGTYSEDKQREVISDLRKKGSKRFEWVLKKFDDTNFYADISLTVFESAGKRRVIAILRNITDRKNNEETLKKRNEELERFNILSVDREMKMIELKREIKQLERKLREAGL